MATLLSIIQNVADSISLPRPDSIIGSTNQFARTLLKHCNDEGHDLVLLDPPLTVLTRVHTFTTTASTEEYDLPTDYSRLIRNSEWDRANARPLIGPLESIDWQVLKSGTIGSGAIGYRFRVFRASSGIGRKVYVDPIPTVSAETLAFEYVSDSWCANAAATVIQTAWAADDDQPIIDARLLELGTEVRYRRSRGLSFGSELVEYNDLVAIHQAQDRPARAINLANRSTFHLIDQRNVPDTGYGS